MNTHVIKNLSCSHTLQLRHDRAPHSPLVRYRYGCTLARAASEPKRGPKKETAISPQCTPGITTKAHVNMQTRPDTHSTP